MAKRPGKLKVLLDSFDPGLFNGRNTLRTGLGFIRTLFGASAKNESLTDVFNYLPVSESWVTSGQPSEAQFVMIREAGFARVINLAPHEAENALQDEAGLLEKLDMRYTHIPVDFKNPTEADFDQFCQAMQDAGCHKVWVHCAANMRVSAFTYRYRTAVLGEAEEVARQHLDQIWKPYGVWETFVGSK